MRSLLSCGSLQIPGFVIIALRCFISLQSGRICAVHAPTTTLAAVISCWLTTSSSDVRPSLLPCSPAKSNLTAGMDEGNPHTDGRTKKKPKNLVTTIIRHAVESIQIRRIKLLSFFFYPVNCEGFNSLFHFGFLLPSLIAPCKRWPREKTPSKVRKKRQSWTTTSEKKERGELKYPSRPFCVVCTLCTHVRLVHKDHPKTRVGWKQAHLKSQLSLSYSFILLFCIFFSLSRGRFFAWCSLCLIIIRPSLFFFIAFLGSVRIDALG